MLFKAGFSTDGTLTVNRFEVISAKDIRAADKKAILMAKKNGWKYLSVHLNLSNQ